MGDSPADLSHRTAAGRWARLGPYYAMFPISFAEQVIMSCSKPNDVTIDPFCGRGTAPFVAMVNGRRALGCDVNPVAWVYSKTKIDPYPESEAVQDRIRDIQRSITSDDSTPVNEFQKLAFCRLALGFINSAKRQLDWKHCQLDRTVAAILIHYLHDKKGRGLSNQLRHSRALSPDYCISWWRNNGHHTPPEIDPQEFLMSRVKWRYGMGIPKSQQGELPIINLGKAETSLPHNHALAMLITTSPPYVNVTNYRIDNWLRLWALNEGPDLPSWSRDQRFTNAAAYSKMLYKSLRSTHRLAHPNATWYIRSDSRPKTRDIVVRVLAELLPNHRAYCLPAPYSKSTQTALYGDPDPKPGETDLLYVPQRKRRRNFTLKFKPLKISCHLLLIFQFAVVSLRWRR